LEKSVEIGIVAIIPTSQGDSGIPSATAGFIHKHHFGNSFRNGRGHPRQVFWASLKRHPQVFAGKCCFLDAVMLGFR
jgi:hypothetical protein